MLAVKVAFARHGLVQQRELGVVNKQAQFAGLGKVQLGGQQGERTQAMVMPARHIGCSHGQQGATQAIAHRLDFSLWHDVAHRIDSAHDARFQIGVHANIAVAGVRIFPGHDEDGMTLLNQVLDHRILGRQVKNVELQYPRGHDQNGLGKHGCGLRRVLDELHQMVAKNHLARRHGHLMAWPEILSTRNRPAAQETQCVFASVAQALQQIGAACFHGDVLGLWIAP